MTCDTCGGRRIVLRPGEETAEAALCECAQSCPDCGGSGWLEQRQEGGYTAAAPCPCQELERRVRLVNEAGIPRRYAECTLDSFEPRLSNHDHLMGYLRRWVGGFSERNRGLLLVGGAGVGKTHLAVAVLRQLILDRGIRVRFVEFFELLASIRATFGTRGGEQRVLGALTAVPVLAVDELGKGRGKGFEETVLDQLINGRYNRSLPTIFTTNYPLRRTDRIHEAGQAVRMEGLDHIQRLLGDPPLEDQVGARVYSRVLDMCTPFVLRGASDYRLQRVREEGPGGA